MRRSLTGLVIAFLLMMAPLHTLAKPKSNQGHNGKRVGWTESNGKHLGLIKQGKIVNEPAKETIVYSAKDIMDGRKPIERNLTVLFEGYKIDRDENAYSVTTNGFDIASGSAVDSSFFITYDMAGTWIVLLVLDSKTGDFKEMVPLISAIKDEDFTKGTALLLNVSDYGSLCYYNENYIYFDKTQNTVIITKDGMVLEEYKSPIIQKVVMYNSWETGKIGLYINDELVYVF